MAEMENFEKGHSPVLIGSVSALALVVTIAGFSIRDAFKGPAQGQVQGQVQGQARGLARGLARGADRAAPISVPGPKVSDPARVQRPRNPA